MICCEDTSAWMHWKESTPQKAKLSKILPELSSLSPLWCSQAKIIPDHERSRSPGATSEKSRVERGRRSRAGNFHSGAAASLLGKGRLSTDPTRRVVRNHKVGESRNSKQDPKSPVFLPQGKTSPLVPSAWCAQPCIDHAIVGS